MARINLEKLASELDVSAAAVSLALNGKAGVSPELRKRILALAEARGYRRRSRVYAVVLPFAGMPIASYLTLLMNALRRCARKRGDVLYFLSKDDLGVLEERNLAGVISLDFGKEIAQTFPGLKNLPLVCINDPANAFEGVGAVSSDEAAGIRKVFACLREYGHREIGYLCIRTALLSYRRSSMRRVLTEFPELTVREQEYTDTFAASMKQLLNTGITALLVPGEEEEFKSRNTLEMFGLRVPEDLSLVTWENPNCSAFYFPPQTTVEQNFSELARRAFSLLDELPEKRTAAATVLVEPLFHFRSSVGVPSKNGQRLNGIHLKPLKQSD